MNKRSLLALTVAALALPVIAHDFWIEPSSHSLEKGALVSVALKVGDFAAGENVQRVQARIADFSVHGPGTDKQVAGREGGEPAGYVRLESEGLFVLGYRSKQTSVELEAQKFEDYLRERGLDGCLAQRVELGEQSNSGRELYSRCAKSIVRVGKAADDQGYGHVLGYTLELIPEKNPFDLKKGEDGGALEAVPLRLYYDGQPLANALVGALSLDLPAVSGEPHQQPITARTDAEGRVKLELPSTGRWMFAAVHMVRLVDDPKGDWESFWASLTVEIPSGDAKAAKENGKDSK